MPRQRETDARTPRLGVWGTQAHFQAHLERPAMVASGVPRHLPSSDGFALGYQPMLAWALSAEASHSPASTTARSSSSLFEEFDSPSSDVRWSVGYAYKADLS